MLTELIVSYILRLIVTSNKSNPNIIMINVAYMVEITLDHIIFNFVLYFCFDVSMKTK